MRTIHRGKILKTGREWSETIASIFFCTGGNKWDSNCFYEMEWLKITVENRLKPKRRNLRIA